MKNWKKVTIFGTAALAALTWRLVVRERPLQKMVKANYWLLERV